MNCFKIRHHLQYKVVWRGGGTGDYLGVLSEAPLNGDNKGIKARKPQDKIFFKFIFLISKHI